MAELLTGLVVVVFPLGEAAKLLLKQAGKA